MNHQRNIDNKVNTADNILCEMNYFFLRFTKYLIRNSYLRLLCKYITSDNSKMEWHRIDANVNE